MSIPEHSDVLNFDSDFVCPSPPESDECDDIFSDLEGPHDVHKAEAGNPVVKHPTKQFTHLC